MGTLPSLLRRFYFIFKEQRDKSKKDSPSQPAPASPFQTRLIPFPLPWLSSSASASSSPLVTACLNFLISVPSCEDNSVWRECFHRLQQSRSRDVERCNASVCLFKVQLYCTSPHNDSVLNMNFTFCWYMDRFKRNILYLLMRVVLFMRVFSPFKQFIA